MCIYLTKNKKNIIIKIWLKFQLKYESEFLLTSYLKPLILK